MEIQRKKGAIFRLLYALFTFLLPLSANNTYIDIRRHYVHRNTINNSTSSATC